MPQWRNGYTKHGPAMEWGGTQLRGDEGLTRATTWLRRSCLEVAGRLCLGPEKQRSRPRTSRGGATEWPKGPHISRQGLHLRKS